MARTSTTSGKRTAIVLALTLGCALGAPLPAGAGSADCAGASAAVSSDTRARDVARIRGAIRCIVSAERRARRLRPLRDQPALRRAAERHSRDMVRRGYFDHVSPSGSRLEARARRAGYLRRVRRWDLGEALGWGTLDEATPRNLVRGMLASPDHRALLLDRSFRDVGIGVALGAPVAGEDEPGLTLTITFGHVLRRR